MLKVTGNIDPLVQIAIDRAVALHPMHDADITISIEARDAITFKGKSKLPLIHQLGRTDGLTTRQSDGSYRIRVAANNKRPGVVARIIFHEYRHVVQMHQLGFKDVSAHRDAMELDANRFAYQEIQKMKADGLFNDAIHSPGAPKGGASARPCQTPSCHGPFQ